MVGTALLARLFGEASPQRDGAAATLEARATAIVPAPLEPGSAEPPAPGRRQRPLALPAEVVQESLGEKVLNAWLQNRHQTLYPLTVNLRALGPGQAAVLARAMAAALLAGERAPGEARIEAALAWLGDVGGGEEVGRTLCAALDAPEPLSALLREVHKAGMAPYAYVVSLVASDPSDEAGQRFLDYLAARLALPANVVRSADRRYRRGGQVPASVRAVSAP